MKTISQLELLLCVQTNLQNAENAQPTMLQNPYYKVAKLQLEAAISNANEDPGIRYVRSTIELLEKK